MPYSYVYINNLSSDSSDVTDNVAYFALRINSKKIFAYLTGTHELIIPYHLYREIQIAHATMAAVVIILFDSSSHSFEGYALFERFVFQTSVSKAGVVPVKATLIRRATVQYSDVSHIRDDHGLQGRPISSVRDGSRLGIYAGRVLCRFIDKKAFHDDPVHYRDQPNLGTNIIPGIHPSIHPPNKSETDAVAMTFPQYLEEFHRRRNQCEPVPSLDNLVYR
jgi:hypothetical protein